MIYLVDGPVYVFRGWFALPDTLRSPQGEPANAFRGFADFLQRLLGRIGGAPVAIAFDESLTRSFRNEIHPGYKAGRELPPAELERQFDWCRRLCRAQGLMELASPRFEADDLIASLARVAHERGEAVSVVSRDKDLIQVLRPGDRWLRSADDSGRDYAAVAEELGCPPERMAAVQALTGDPVDDIPGVPGIGIKTATRLLAHFGELDQLMDAAAAADTFHCPGLRGAARFARLIKTHRATVELARQLTELRQDAPLPAGEIRRDPPDRTALAELDAEAGLGRRLSHLWLAEGA